MDTFEALLQDYHRIVVFIHLPQEISPVPAGIFEHTTDPGTGEGIGRFVYGAKYRERKKAIALDPIHLPLSGEPYLCQKNNGVFGVFRDALPDLWGRIVLEKMSGINFVNMNEAGMLLLTDGSQTGNLGFANFLQVQQNSPMFAPVSKLPDLMNAAQLLEGERTIDSQFVQLLFHGSSMGGARPKILIESENTLWLAKFPSRYDIWNNAKIEYATMSLASKCGIPVPKMRVISTELGDILLEERFDRIYHEDGWMKKGYLSAMTLLDLQNEERDIREYSYITLASKIKKADHSSWKAFHMGEQLFQRIAFNIFCRNTDDHPRNHGFLWDGKRLSLSPAFDITPTSLIQGLTKNFKLSMSLGKYGKEANLNNLLSSLDIFDLDYERAYVLLSNMSKVIKNWKNIFENECGVSPKDSELFRDTFFSSFLNEVELLPIEEPDEYSMGPSL